ncbi:WG repeat-containing protein [Clostridiaceae bacterium M8S5]|nr:WG repeat-containing protein [Clostridiaceae bacterium M8S5]
MKKIIVFGLSAIIASNMLGCQVAEGVRNKGNKIPTSHNKATMFSNNSNKKFSKEVLNQLKFIDKHSYKGNLRIQRYSDQNGIVPFALSHPQKENEYFGFINGKDGGHIPPTYDYIQFNKVKYFESGLEPVKKGGKYGYINIKGEKIIDFIYEGAMDFENDVAAVNKNGLWGYVNTKGDTVIKPQFKQVDTFIEGVNVAIVTTKNDKQALINKQGEVLIQSDHLFSLSNPEEKNNDYICFAAMKNDKHALVKIENGTTKQLTDYIYDQLFYDNGEIKYSKMGLDLDEEGTLDLEGKETKETKEEYNPNGLQYGKVHNGRRIVTNMDGLCGIADENKKIILSPKFTHIEPFISKYYAIVQTADMKNGIIDREGNIIIKPSNLQIQPVENKKDYITVGEEGGQKSKVQLYDVKSKKYIGGKYANIHPMNDDFIVMVNDKKSGLMNKNGEFIVEPYDYYSYEEHKKGYIVKSSENGLYITNLAGKKLSEETYQIVQPIDKNNYRVVMQKLKYGLADKDGNLLVPCVSEFIKAIDKTKAQIVMKNGDEVIIGTVEIPSK